MPNSTIVYEVERVEHRKHSWELESKHDSFPQANSRIEYLKKYYPKCKFRVVKTTREIVQYG